jgi:hypothetical protein
VCFGSSKEICLDNFGIIEAIQMTNDPFNELYFDGILGIGLL